jgi:hydrogenase maturation protease
MTKKPLALFLGNPILSDDKIVLAVGEMLRKRLESAGYEVEILEKSGFSLIDHLEDREEAVIVDSVKTGRYEVGRVISLSLADFEQYAPFTSHYAGIPDALELMKQLDLNPPRHLRILGIEVEDPYTVSENMSEKLTKRLSQLAEETFSIILSPQKVARNVTWRRTRHSLEAA